MTAFGPHAVGASTADASPLHITVLGSGSVGLAVAASLARAGQRVTLLGVCAAEPAPAPGRPKALA